MKHDFYTAEDFKDADQDSWGARNVVEGGLAICKVCGGMEGSLTTDCCGERIHYETDQKVYAGNLDFRKDKGWVSEKNPTNQAWEYAEAYIRLKKRRNNGSCYGTYEILPECATCEGAAECRKDTETIKSYEARRVKE